MSTSLGRKGVTVGSRLQTIIEELEKKVEGYPFEMSYHTIADKKQRTAIVNTLDSSISYMEATIGLYRNFDKGIIGQELSDESTGSAEASFKAKSGAVPEIKEDELDEESAMQDAIESPEIVDITYASDYISNVIDTIKPNDDRFDKIFNYIDDEQYHKDSRVRIGDVLLTIPPLSIQVQKTSQINKIKTLRTKSSVLTNAGQTHTTLQMELYFHDIENINGMPYKTGDYTFYVDGLRTLIAQFAKCPFVPIDNPYINNVIGVHSVALLDLTVSSVPGFPHSLNASITLLKFEHEALMPTVPFLGEAINYPLMRWYYQQALVDRNGDNASGETMNSGRTYYKGLDGVLDNNFSFQIANRRVIESRQNALADISTMDTPEKVRSLAEEGTNQYGFRLEDANTAMKVLKRYDEWLPVNNNEMEKHSVIDDSSNILTFKSVYKKKYNLTEDEYENAVEEGKKFYEAIYSDGISQKGSEFFAPQLPHFYYQRLGAPDITNYEVDTSYTTVPSDVAQSGVDFSNGYIQIGLKSSNHVDMFKGVIYSANKKIDGVPGYYLPVNADVISKLDTIAGQKEVVNEELDDYEDSYREYEAIINATEDNIPMDEVTISGLLPISLNVMYSNQFATLPILESGDPALQYLGSQDPYVQISFEVEDVGLTQLNELIEKVSEYSRTYRMGISTGFLGITNQLTDLFGIRSVMIESAQYATIPNFPGRNQVNMVLVGFNKTQRRAEELAGFNASIEKTSLEDVKNNGNQQSSDRIVEMRLRKMEVYPDLELPTYDELNEALKKLKIEVPEIINKTGSLYVDPDFYISTPWTFREAIHDEYLGDHTLYLEDSSGIKVMTSSNSDKVIEGDDSAWEILNRLSAETAKVESAFSWGGNSEIATDGNGDGITDPVTYQSSDIADYFLNSDDKGKRGYQKAPSAKEALSWGLISESSQYNKWLKNPNPSEADVWNRIRTQLIAELGDIGGGTNWHTKADVTDYERRTAYRSSKALYALVYNDIVDELSSEELKALKARKDKYKEPKINKESITEADFAKMKNKIPFERVHSMVKAFLHFASNWKQFNSKGEPIIDGAYNCVGLGGVPIADAAGDINEAKRLTWDWKYNLDRAIKQLSEYYHQAKALDKVKEIEFLARPWEVMIYLYRNGEMPATDADLNKDGVVANVLEIFYKSYNSTTRWGTPTVPLNADAYSKSLNLTTQQTKLLKGKATKEDYINILVNDLDYTWQPQEYVNKNSKDYAEWVKYKEENGYGILHSTTTDDFNEMSRRLLGQLSESKVKEIFKEKVTKLKKDADWNKSHPVLGFFEDVFDGVAGILGVNQPTEVGEEIVEKVGEAYSVLEFDANRLIGDDDPQQIYREMYTDLIKYDHRGRLLRAFPAFQMLIIDEGKWMGRFKFWDNMYGFNAIQSIDVYKSRKIAADTAVIKMTNIYSNLTTKTTNTNYQTYKSDFWNNLILENPTEELMDVRKNLLNQMMLETGARIHLRMGYGADAAEMPIVFNGTITELSTQEVVEIVAQGDGVELGNVVSGDPEDDNNGFFTVTEPRDLICELLTSKGSWFKDAINSETAGVFFRDNPLGIMHFGIPGSIAPAGNLWFWNSNYGEAAQNVYSSNGTPTFSQWSHSDGTKRTLFDRNFWETLTSTNITRWFQPGDEDNIIVKFYNNTTWDIIQTLAYCSLDYIAAVHPFETRSTLFFGKPYWRLARSYESTYRWDSAEEVWLRQINKENRKPYMQFRYYDSHQDIIKNGIKASEDGVFTNVIVNYDGHQTPILSADYDIRYDKQKTQVVDAEIVARFPGVPGGDYTTSEKQARNFGMSALKDSLKDMYKGGLLVIGDPSVKPHDAMYIADMTSSMNGMCLVKSVTHHMSIETGFVTNVEPDAYVVNDDLVMLSLGSWGASAMIGMLGAVTGYAAAMRAIKKVQQSRTIGKLVNKGGDAFRRLEDKGVKILLDMMDNDDYAVKAYKNAFDKYYELPKNADPAVRARALDNLDRAADDLQKYVEREETKYKAAKKGNGNKKIAKESLKNAKFLAKKSKVIASGLRATRATGGLVFKTAFTVAKALVASTGVGLLLSVGVTLATEGIFEMYSRFKEALQCVIMMPLRYRGKELTAGINGHMGMVVGDNPGKLDKLVSAVAFEEDDSDKSGQDWYNWVFETMNLFSGSDKDYSVSEIDLTK